MVSPKEKGLSSEVNGEEKRIRISFTNPELLRAYILDSARQPGATLAERISGIRENNLGELPLDGELFQSMRVSLVVEPDRDPRRECPKAIMRADLTFGQKSSIYTRFQETRLNKESSGFDFDSWFWEKISTAFENSPPEQEEGLVLMQQSRNTARIHQAPLSRETFWQEPLVVLQVYDQDVGFGSISVSLVSFNRYAEEWHKRFDEWEKKEANGWEIDKDEVDSWRFDQPVGVDTYDAERFGKTIAFYEEVLAKTIRALYQGGKITTPNLYLEIEPPLAYREKENITFDDIGGQRLAVDFLRALAQNIKARKSGFTGLPMIFLAGPPGNGKSSLVKAFAEELESPLVIKTSRDLPPKLEEADTLNFLESGYFEARAAARRIGGRSIYCLEGIEAILGQSQRLHDFLLNTMDKWGESNDVLFMATSNFPDQLHPGIVSRFQAIGIPLPDKEGRREILQIHAAKLDRLIGHPRVFGEADFGEVAQRLDGFSGRDILKFLNAVYQMNVVKSQNSGRGWLPIDTEFLLSLIPQEKKIGFRTS